ncbi:hypothetical protein [Bacillus haynesii]|uniref:hypothetical protein n=1 Tax=Bacillus haynesii TaxID=1925021 RepID=UPI0022809037|nr:hypothetical protein [Bacillus haynesii]MCY8539427.1 hypothetical protein [Bacillus haynesii]
MTNQFNKSFTEALEELVSGKAGFAQGEFFEKGLYLEFDKTGVLQLVNGRGTSRERENAIISKGMLLKNIKRLMLQINKKSD